MPLRRLIALALLTVTGDQFALDGPQLEVHDYPFFSLRDLPYVALVRSVQYAFLRIRETAPFTIFENVS